MAEAILSLLKGNIMKNLFFTVLLPITFIGCASNSYPVNNIPPKKTFVKSEPETKETFRKDDHRYNSYYQNFDYNRLGYSSDNGLYYGYFDHQGYFYNNIYFIYDDEYTYEDRYYHKGPFSPNLEQIRIYIYHDNNDWNQEHHYREPNQYVGHFLYYERNPRPKFRVYHRQEVGPSY